MKALSILFVINAIAIITCCIKLEVYHSLVFAALSLLTAYLIYPEKRNREEPFRNSKTWNDGDV